MGETVKHAAALATDLGADIVKLPLSGSVAEMRQIVESCPLPVVTAGGSQVSDAEFNQFIADVMKSGARGIAAGRNVFMAADPGHRYVNQVFPPEGPYVPDPVYRPQVISDLGDITGPWCAIDWARKPFTVHDDLPVLAKAS